MDIHKDRTESTKEEMKAKMSIYQEKMEAAIHSIQSKSEEAMKHRGEDVLACVDQRTQALRKERIEKIDGTQVDVQALKTSLDKRTKSLQENLADTRKEGPSRRARPHVPGRDPDNGSPN
jgi:hypothetical protein